MIMRIITRVASKIIYLFDLSFSRKMALTGSQRLFFQGLLAKTDINL